MTVPSIQQSRASHRVRTAVAAVVGALWMASAAQFASAQYRIEDGRARDANNRVGDYGRNDLGSTYRRDLRATPNQIVTNNVAGLYGFRGNVGYREAKEFRGPVASEFSDSFIRRSSGGYSGYGGNYPTAFYTRSRTVDPPTNYVREGYGLGSYVPKPAGESDQVIQYETRNTGYLNRIGTLPPPNNLILPAPAGSESGSFISATPLTGIRQYQPGQAVAGNSFEAEMGDLPRSSGAVRLNPEDVRRMQDELRNAVPGEADPTERQSPQGQAEEQGAGATRQPLGAPLGTPLGQAADGKAQITQGTRYRFNLPPEQQSEQYAKMRQQLEQYNKDATMTDEQAYRAFKEAQKAGTADPAAAKPALPGTPELPGTPSQRDPNATPETEQRGTPPVTIPGGAAPQPDKEARKPAPIKIDSLAAGVTGKGLTDLLSDAEAKMREGKFAAAIDRYDAAEQVAPNNPLVSLGRANAELGAGYYSRAEAHLRQAFSADKALLVAQYNLQNFLGEDRLQFLVKDLKEIANREKGESRPVFLLAYVAYNTGNERMAAGYLDLAEKRGEAKDPIYPLIRQHWNLPDESAPELDVEQPATQPAGAAADSPEPAGAPNK